MILGTCMWATEPSPVKLRAPLKNVAILPASFQSHERESLLMTNVFSKDLDQFHKILQ